MATNLQEAARRMYSAKGFTDYGKVLGAGLKKAVRDIAIAREQEEKEAKAERKQRDAFALDLYAKRPSINEGAIPPEMLSVVKNWLLDTRNQYNEATQNLSGDISDPSYRAAIDMANKTKTSYTNLSSQMQMFKENQKEYLETVATTGFSNSNSQTDINLVSSIYNKDFSNFTIDDNGKIILETSQGIKTLDEVNELFESLNAKAIKETQGISALVNQSKADGVKGITRSQSDIDSTYAEIGLLFADKKNTLSYVFDTPGVKEFISNKFKLEDGSFTDEKMDLAGKKDGIIDDEWLRNPENYDLVYDAFIEHAADLVQRGNEEGIKIYNAKKDEGKPKNEEENVLYKNTELDDLRGFSKVFDKAPVTPFTGPFSEIQYQKRDRILNEEKTRLNFIKNVISGWSSYKYGKGQEYVTRDEAFKLWKSKDENKEKPDSDFDLIYNPNIEVFYFNTGEETPLPRPVPVNWDSNKSIIGWQVKTGLTKATKDVKEFLSSPENLQGILDTDNTN